jgi:hypothetical protein
MLREGAERTHLHALETSGTLAGVVDVSMLVAKDIHPSQYFLVTLCNASPACPAVAGIQSYKSRGGMMRAQKPDLHILTFLD